MRAQKHDDVQYAVDDASGHEHVFDTFDAAAGYAVAVAVSGKENVSIDVLVWSEIGARHYGGDDAVESYEEDPDASVFERIEIKVNLAGRIA